MATRNRTSRTGRSQTCPYNVGPNPSTIRNPHARPKAKPGQRVRPLPAVVRCPKAGVTFALLRGEEPPGMDVIGGAVWQLVYRCVYPHGVRDEIARFSQVIARDEAEAVRALQELMYGFAQRIELYEVWHFEPVEGKEGTADGRG